MTHAMSTVAFSIRRRLLRYLYMYLQIIGMCCPAQPETSKCSFLDEEPKRAVYLFHDLGHV